MAYGICLPRRIMAQDVNSLVRNAVSAAAYENGFVGYFSAKSSTAGEGEVWTMTAPVTAHLYDLWMAYEPEIVDTNAQYRNLDPDIRNFYKPAGEIFSVFKPQIGDIITLDDNALAGTKSTNEYVVATNAAQALTWASAAVSGLSLHLVKDPDPISIGLGTIGSQRISTIYQFEVVALA